jgi:hypothetical protein
LARPATWLSGSLRAAISGTNAASTCNSPSKSASSPVVGDFLRQRGGGLDFADGGCVALPLVEYESRATRGRTPSN